MRSLRNKDRANHSAVLQVGEVDSTAFTKAFFGLYLGDSPVSPEGKTSISKGLAKLVVSSPEAAKTENNDAGSAVA